MMRLWTRTDALRAENRAWIWKTFQSKGQDSVSEWLLRVNEKELQRLTLRIMNILSCGICNVLLTFNI